MERFNGYTFRPSLETVWRIVAELVVVVAVNTKGKEQRAKGKSNTKE